jgi:hypothetical protein
MSDSTIKTIFVGAIASLVIFSVTTFYTDFLKQPRIDLDLKSDGRNQYGLNNTINIANDGDASANNVRVTFMSNVSITVSNPTFYTENITGPKKNDRGWWTMDIDRFAPKSMLTIYSALDSSKLNTPFDVFITYDEGSKWNSFVLSEENQLKEKVDKTSLDITTPIVSIIGAGVAFFIARLYLRVKRHTVIRYGRLLNKLAHDMCVVVLYIKKQRKYL